MNGFNLNGVQLSDFQTAGMQKIKKLSFTAKILSYVISAVYPGAFLYNMQYFCTEMAHYGFFFARRSKVRNKRNNIEAIFVAFAYG